MTEKLLTLTQVAALLGCCRATARKMALPYVRLYTRGRKLYCMSDVMSIIDSRKSLSDSFEDIFSEFVRTPRKQ